MSSLKVVCVSSNICIHSHIDTVHNHYQIAIPESFDSNYEILKGNYILGLARNKHPLLSQSTVARYDT